MQQQYSNNPEVLSGVPETVTATAMRLRELSEAAMLEASLKVPETPSVVHAPKPIETHPEPTPVVPLNPVGLSVTAVSEAQRAVEDALRSAA